MTQINGGLVRHEKTISRGDFQPEKAVVELTFTVDENDDYASILDRAVEIAMGKTHQMLGAKTTAKAAPATPAANTNTKADLEAKAREEAGAAPRRGRPPKPAKTEETAGSSGASSSAPQADDWASEPAKAPAAAAAEDWGAEPPAKPMTDAELLEAITAHNAKVQNPLAIRKLIGKYTGGVAGKRANDVPADQRAAFVAELHEIKPLA